MITFFMFQSTHLHEVWQRIRLPHLAFPQFQSTHLHEVWQYIFSSRFLVNSVSIHTPTWGVTHNGNYTIGKNQVSIHTPTWGVTTLLSSIASRLNCFNPHTYMRCDLVCNWKRTYQYKFQSTHLHEVWLKIRKKDAESDVSIHTPTWGVTMIKDNYCGYMQFQSTHLHEVWPSFAPFL